ncbi:MAG: segregation/condensation protein A [Desulfobacterales bacterium]
MADDHYKVKLENVFEGPMDLLIHLIRKNEVDITDIPIALITRQYLAYLEWLQRMNIDFAGEFLLMAATLAHIKSRTLLPSHSPDVDEDPRLEIARPLLEYLQIKQAAEELAQRQLLGEDTFVRPPSSPDDWDDAGEETIHVGLFELIDAFQKILANIAPDHRVDLTTERISIKDRITEIVDVLEAKGSITFTELFASENDKSDVVVTFLAVLEMVKLCLIRVVQHLPTGIIRLFYL